MFNLLKIIISYRKDSVTWASDQCTNSLPKPHMIRMIATHKSYRNEVDLRWAHRNLLSALPPWVPCSQPLSVATVRNWGVKRDSKSSKVAILWETARRCLVLHFSSNPKSLRVLGQNAKGVHPVGWKRLSSLLSMFSSSSKMKNWYQKQRNK